MKVESMRNKSINTKSNHGHKSPLLRTLMIGFLVLSVSGCSTTALSESYSVPNEALGIVSIESPTVGSLLHLRGLAGKGALVRKDAKAACHKSAIRIVAGDFNGNGISIKDSKKIMLAIYSHSALKKLRDGDAVVSEDYTVSMLGRPKGDIEIISGLALSQGFVLDPGAWSFSSWLGINEVEGDC